MTGFTFCKISIRKMFVKVFCLIGLFLTGNIQIVQSALVNCDEIQAQDCSCFGPNDNGDFKIACPNEGPDFHQVIVKVHPKPNEGFYTSATLVIKCDHRKPDFPWRLIQGLNLSMEGEEFAVTKLSIHYCPLPSKHNGLKELCQHLSINPNDITAYEFVSHRPISTFPNYMLLPLFNLINLNLSSNQLTTIPNLNIFSRLKRLQLHSNSIEAIPKDAFEFNPFLENLGLASNKITHIEQGSLPESLKFLNLTHNEISIFSRNTLSELKNLQRISLNENPLENLDPIAFVGLTELHILKMDRCKFPHFPILRDLPSLQNLTISFNPKLEFVCVPDSDLEDRENENETTTIPTQNYTETNPPTSLECIIKDLPSLTHLYLTNDGLKYIPEFDNLPNLTFLSLRRNKIQTVPTKSFAMLSSLRRLDLSRNQIESIPAIENDQLRALNLNRNLITRLEASSFRGLGSLKILRVKKNKITYIDPNLYSFLSALEVLNLSDNFLDVIHPAFASASGSPNNLFDLKSIIKACAPQDYLSDTKRINLEGNPLCLNNSHGIQVNKAEIEENTV